MGDCETAQSVLETTSRTWICVRRFGGGFLRKQGFALDSILSGSGTDSIIGDLNNSSLGRKKVVLKLA